ncbi:hypothetical protein ACNOYE_23305 [Nannocystaceae bacterium ST9]
MFVESNWVVDVCAPAFRRSPSALALLDRAARGEISMHVPSIALREAKSVILRKYQPKEQAILQQFRKWAVEHGQIDSRESAAANDFLTRFSNTVAMELAHLDDRIAEVANSRGMNVFALDEAMLNRSISLRTEVPDPGLKPFDETILAAVLVRATELAPEHLRLFCTADLDLSPIVRNNTRKHLAAVYDQAKIEVRTNFDIDDLVSPSSRDT